MTTDLEARVAPKLKFTVESKTVWYVFLDGEQYTGAIGSESDAKDYAAYRNARLAAEQVKP